MANVRAEPWAERYDRAAAEMLGGKVIAAAQFLRPRGWKALGHALADGPIGLVDRARGRPQPVRLPQACLVAVTDEEVHLLIARAAPGAGPMPRPIRRLAAWRRSAIEVDASRRSEGTRLTITPEGGARVVLYGPPSELTARVVFALTA